ncbi:stage II sporulation protein E, partial [Candidatus Magnetobacterium bavaricum]
MDNAGNSGPYTIDSSRFMESVRMFQEMTSSLAGTFELQPFLEHAIKSYKHFSKSSRCAIFLVNDERSKLIMKANEGYKVTMHEYDYNVAIDEPKIGLTVWVAKNKVLFSAKSFDEIKKHPAWLGKHDTPEYSEGDKCTSLIVVPLIVNMESLGVIKAENKIPDQQHPEGYFSEQDEYDLQIFANTIAVAIESLKKIEKLKQSITDKDNFINAIAKFFVYYKGGSSLYNILDSIVIWIRDVCNATACSIFLKNNSGTKLVMKASRGFSVDLRDKATYDLNTKQFELNEGLTVRIFKNRENIYATNREELEKQPAFLAKYDNEYLKGMRVVSFIGLPLIVGNEVLGVLKAEMAEDDSSGKISQQYFSNKTYQMLDIL